MSLDSSSRGHKKLKLLRYPTLCKVRAYRRSPRKSYLDFYKKILKLLRYPTQGTRISS